MLNRTGYPESCTKAHCATSAQVALSFMWCMLCMLDYGSVSERFTTGVSTALDIVS